MSLATLTGARFPHAAAVTVPPAMLLLHFNGSNGGTSFPDSSTYNHTMSITGTVTTSTATPKYGSAAGNFVKPSLLSTTPQTDFDLGTGDFCFETWVRYASLPTSGVPATIFSKYFSNPSRSAYRCYYEGTSAGYLLRYVVGGTETAYNLSPGLGVHSVNTWYHIAMTRESGTLRFFVNGDLKSSQTVSSAHDVVNANFNVGALSASGTPVNGLDGELDDFRFVKGYAVYTANFTPPTSQLPDS